MSILLTSTFLYGQDDEVQAKRETIKDEISKLSFMLGEWEGPGWYMHTDGTKEKHVDHEKMRLSKDKTFLIMDVNAVDENNADESQVFIFYYDTQQKHYVFNAYAESMEGRLNYLAI